MVPLLSPAARSMAGYIAPRKQKITKKYGTIPQRLFQPPWPTEHRVRLTDRIHDALSRFNFLKRAVIRCFSNWSTTAMRRRFTIS
jgi:hypothetical protein